MRPGGMATLTLAMGPDGTQWVLRELQEKYRWNFRMHYRFFRGARIRRRVCPHPNIVTSTCWGYNANFLPCEQLEYCPGENLAILICHKDPIVSRHLFPILRQACEAISHVHSQGYIHLDVKPENIIVWEQEGKLRVKLTDFDLSLRMSATRDQRKAGTPEYMAPEQLDGGRIGPETDIFAFGVMAYFLLTGKKPFAGESMNHMYTQKTSGRFQVQEPSKLVAGIAPKLNWLVMKCLECEPANRFPNMTYLLQELNRV